MSGRILVAIWVAFTGMSASAGSQSLEGGSKDSANGGIESGRSQTGGQSYGDRDRGGGWGFYSYPSQRQLDTKSGGTRDHAFSELSSGTPSHYANTHGSAYYGRDYGAPYFGGGYYDRGTYYRERQDR